MTPLNVAAEKGFMEMVVYLVQNGANFLTKPG
jgi:hypothetical protein